MKEGRNVILVTGLVLVLLLMPFASANIFTNIFNKITGKSVASQAYDEKDCVGAGNECQVVPAENGAVSDSKCLDSDSGKDYFTKGVVTDTDGYKRYDECSGNSLYEYYCSTSTVDTYTVYTCPNGCENGACVEETLKAASVSTCSDSDGSDINNKGYVTGKTSNNEPYTYYDYCSSDRARVLEYTCEGTTPKTSSSQCLRGCSDGACTEDSTADLVIETETCDDGKKNQDETGVDCGGVCDACKTTSKVEGECELGMNQCSVGYECVDDGHDASGYFGICKEEAVEEVVECIDSDGVNNYYSAGAVTVTKAGNSLGIYSDKCVKKGDGVGGAYVSVDGSYYDVTPSFEYSHCSGEDCYVSEFYCVEGQDMPKASVSKCENGCDSGACLKEGEYPQCEETLSEIGNEIWVCEKGEFAGNSIEVIERSDNFIQIKTSNRFVESMSDRLIEGDVFGITEISGEAYLITVLNIGVDGNNDKVRFRIAQDEDDVSPPYAIQCEETLANEIYVCGEDEGISNSLQVLDVNISSVELRTTGSFEDVASKVLSEGDVWEVMQVIENAPVLITVLNIGVDGNEHKVRLRIKAKEYEEDSDYEETPISCEEVEGVVIGTGEAKVTEGGEFKAMGLKSFTFYNDKSSDGKVIEFDYLGQDIKNEMIPASDVNNYEYLKIKDFKFYGKDDVRNYIIVESKVKYKNICGDSELTGVMDYYCNGTDVDYSFVKCENGCVAETGSCSEEDLPYRLGEYNGKLMVISDDEDMFGQFIEDTGCGNVFETFEDGLEAKDVFYFKKLGSNNEILTDSGRFVPNAEGIARVTEGEEYSPGVIVEKINFVEEGSPENYLLLRVEGVHNACSNRNLVMPQCNGDKLDFEFDKCTNGCSDGACYIPGVTDCTGCMIDDKCYNFGYRKSGKFCSEESGFLGQYTEGSNCNNNFECGSNVCVGGQCISQSFWEMIMDWFNKMFS